MGELPVSDDKLYRLYESANQLQPVDVWSLSRLLRRVSRIGEHDRARGQIMVSAGLHKAGVFRDVAFALASDAVKTSPSYLGFDLLAKFADQAGDFQLRDSYLIKAQSQPDAPPSDFALVASWASAELELRKQSGDTATERRRRLDDFFAQASASRARGK
jgi:uncharacterized protein HemY